MKYFIEKDTTYPFETAVQKITEAMNKEGFGILARRDMHKTFKDKLNVDFRNYTILEACNPLAAYEAIKREDNIGILLPCNVVVQQTGDGKTKVAIVNPPAAMQGVENPEMKELASEAQTRLQDALNTI